MNDLPDSAFALVVKGEKDSEGKMVPTTNRNLPQHDANGKVDLPHLRNAMARVTHTSLSKEVQKLLDNGVDVKVLGYQRQ